MDHWQPVYTNASGTLTPFHGEPPRIGACPQRLQLELLTPLRLKHRGHYVDVDQLDARVLLGALATRIRMLAAHYGAAPRGAAPFEHAALHAAIDEVSIETSHLRWVDWTRYSSRQRTAMQLGGLLGQLTLSGPGLAPLWPLIALGQWLHLGKNTSFGLGFYRLRETPPGAA